MYTYKTVPAPTNLSVRSVNDTLNAVESFSEIINKECVNGWEFYSMETISVSTNPGCFSLGKRTTPIVLNMLVFRKEKQ